MGRFWSILFLLVPILGVGRLLVGAWRAAIGCRKDISEHGHRSTTCSTFILILTGRGVRRHRGAAVLVPVEVRRPRRTRDPVKYTHGSHNLEVVWTILPAATLLFIAIYQMNAWADVKMRQARRLPPTVEVTGAAVRVADSLSRARTASSTRRTTSITSTTCTCRSNEEILRASRRARTCCTTSSCRTCGSSRTPCPAWRSVWFKANETGDIRPGLRRAVRLGALQDEGPADRRVHARTTKPGWQAATIASTRRRRK